MDRAPSPRTRIDSKHLLSLLRKKEQFMMDFLAATRSAASLCDEGTDDMDPAKLVSLIELRETCMGEIDEIDQELTRIGPNPGDLSRAAWESILQLLGAIRETTRKAATLSQNMESSLALSCRRFQGKPSPSLSTAASGRSHYGDKKPAQPSPRFLDTRS